MHDGIVMKTWGVQLKQTGQWIGRVHPVGLEPQYKAEARANAGLFAGSNSMATLLQEAVKAWADQFDGPGTDLSISGADLLEWFAQWRLRARTVVDAEATP